MASQDDFDIAPLLASMDLSRAEVDELFERAHRVWEDAKAGR